MRPTLLDGKYTLLRKLAQGGMAEVFLARQSGLEGFEKLVVIKRMLPAIASDQGYVRMFLDEARTAADLRHPNVVQIYEVNEDHGAYFIVMEFLHGHTVSHVIRRCLELGEVFPLELGVRMIMDAAQGLHHAHTKTDLRGKPLHIVHRDISPQNLMVTYDGITKVLDFGVAKVASQKESTAEGVIKGKFAYMAPEQASALPVDHRVDLFALGVVLHELTTLRRVFAGFSPAETLALVVACQVPRPSTLVHGYPEPLEKVVMKALARDPKDRFQDGESFAQALEQVARALNWQLSHSQVGGRVLRLFRETLESQAALAASQLEEGSATQGERRVPARAQQPAAPAPGEHQTVLLAAVQDFLATNADGRRFVDEAKAFADASPDARRTNLPPAPTSFVGRAAELNELQQRFSRGARMVSVTGMAGMGKSRLAQEWARTAATSAMFPGGAWWCDLAATRDRDDISGVVARSLDLAPVVAGAEEGVVQVGRVLATREPTVLVLDGAEHVIDEIEICAGAWLAAAPALRVLVTSQQSTSTVGEEVMELAPLPLPVAGQAVRDSDAVKLFIARGKRASPESGLDDADPLLLAEVVQQLEGVPLAIELAAARLRDNSLSQLVERLPQRATTGDSTAQRTVEGALQWSWQLLEPLHQNVLAQLSVFRQGFTLEAAEAVVKIDHARGYSVAEIVGALRSRHFLRTYVPPEFPGEARFGMYELVRSFVDSRLTDDVRTGARERHADFYCGAAEHWAESVHTHGGVERLKRLALEMENVQGAWQHAVSLDPSRERTLMMARLALALDPLWQARGWWSRQLGLLDAVAQAGLNNLVPGVRARVLHTRGNARKNRGMLPDAESDLRQAESDALASHDRRLVARVRCDLGVALFVQGRLDDAVVAYRQSLTVARDVGDALTEGRVQCFLGIHHFVRGQLAEAQTCNEAALPLTQQTGDRLFEGRLNGNLGALQAERGDANAARTLYARALDLLGSISERRLQAYYRGKLASLDHEQGNVDAARSGYEIALATLRQVGDRRHEGLFTACLASLEAQAGHLERAETHLNDALAALTTVGDPLLLGACHVHSGLLHVARALQSIPEERAKHLSAAKQVLAAADAPALPMPSTKKTGPVPLRRSVTSMGNPLARSLKEQSDEVRFAVRVLSKAMARLG